MRQDNKAVDVAALRGKTFALSRIANEHCRLFAERRCVPEGMTLDKFFKKVSAPGTAQDALDEGQADEAQDILDDIFDQYEIEDTWNVVGLAATGSNDIVVKDAAVPSHRMLDVMSTRALRAFLRGLRDQGHCVLFSSHIMQEVAALCDRVVVIARGRVQAEGTLDELRAQAGEQDLEEAFVRIMGPAQLEILGGEQQRFSLL